MAVNIERILERAESSLRRMEVSELQRLRETSERAYRNIAAEIRRRWPEALAEASGQAPVFAEARARLLLEQLQPYLAALDYGTPESGVPDVIRSMIRLGAEHGAETATELLSAYGAGARTGINLAGQMAVIDQRALEAAVTNTSARLRNHGATAVRQIEDAVVEALVRGRGPQSITREIREALRGDGRIPAAGLHYRAETIAQTELAIAKTNASLERYEEWEVEYIQWYATQSERTCPWCAHRHGKAYEMGTVTVPAHPRCHCYAAPFRREFTESGLVDLEYWEAQQEEIRERVPEPKSGLTAFERNQGKEYPRAAWTPSSGWTSAAR